MIIKILGAESLGVRGLSCSVELKGRKIIIDPGIALGWSRYGFLPHPFQIAVGAGVRQKIIEELKDATDVIFSHFDGDHCPLANPNPYQLGIHEVKDSLSKCLIWAKSPDNSPPTQQRRRGELSEIINRDLPSADGIKNGPLEFSFPVPHGQRGGKERTVMMSRIEENGMIFVHASDIQLLDRKTTERILEWKPDIVLTSGPPLYHYSSSLSQIQRENAWHNAVKLAENVDTLVIDHHLLRSEEGMDWLEELRHNSKGRVLCAADYMQRTPVFLEAWRKELYEWLPAYNGWHEDYQQGTVDLDFYRIRGWEVLVRNGKVNPCKWYYCCPIKEYTDEGKLEREWIENYCLVRNKKCIRYQMEERGEYHPDNMLPNGEIREDLYY